MNAADGDDGDDGATNLSSYERATSMAELLARRGESWSVQVAEARAGTRPKTASRLTPCSQHRERVWRGQAGPEYWVTTASKVALLTKEKVLPVQGAGRMTTPCVHGNLRSRRCCNYCRRWSWEAAEHRRWGRSRSRRPRRGRGELERWMMGVEVGTEVRRMVRIEWD